eukprot:Blabericola_migrator_1__6969@NODE_352_length_9495_cov_44_513789_g282_i0_p2_GENE_NODE_352_length_9495_cov_44_513789_g282_i0NODE_352_length_9495_cov_44_513789_g282_i0_p2_ORF_typecomplete_len619_score117_42AAA_22/PF13401_6/0_0067AAA_22/PF13401_6/6_4e03AAA_22/PF13401_6/1_2e03AAA_33/PF13671_6/0_036AAA_33/PF13671_6/6_1e03AAA_33/PF13671_6/1_7e02Rad17/PF03215_15/0_0017AAA_16/PF13191_6/0_0056AAA_16/PF13191_6/2e03AAA_18/PF13238_6/0_0099AAA/PF00004_29/0_012ATPase_2/PF01637_18/0_07ATPase_2/PF01637_18/1e03AA
MNNTQNLETAFKVACGSPCQWLVIIGPPGCGKESSLRDICRQLKVAWACVDALEYWHHIYRYSMLRSHRVERQKFEDYLDSLAEKCESTVLDSHRTLEEVRLDQAQVMVWCKGLEEVMLMLDSDYSYLLTTRFLSQYRGLPVIFVMMIEPDSKNHRAVSWARGLVRPNSCVTFKSAPPTKVKAKVKAMRKLSETHIKKVVAASQGDLRYAEMIVRHMPPQALDNVDLRREERKVVFSVLGRAFYDKRSLDLVERRHRDRFNKLHQAVSTFETNLRDQYSLVSPLHWQLHFGSPLDLFNVNHQLDTLLQQLSAIDSETVIEVTQQIQILPRPQQSTWASLCVEEASDLGADLNDFDDLPEPAPKRRRVADSETPNSEVCSSTTWVVKDRAINCPPELFPCVKPDFQYDPKALQRQPTNVHGLYRWPSVEPVEPVVEPLPIELQKEIPYMLATGCTRRLSLRDSTMALAELCQLNAVEVQYWPREDPELFASLAIRLVCARSVDGPVTFGKSSFASHAFERSRYKTVEESRRLVDKHLDDYRHIIYGCTKMSKKKFMTDVGDFDIQDRAYRSQPLSNTVSFIQTQLEALRVAYEYQDHNMSFVDASYSDLVDALDSDIEG